MNRRDFVRWSAIGGGGCLLRILPVSAGLSQSGSLFSLQAAVASWPAGGNCPRVIVAIEHGFFKAHGIRLTKEDILVSEGGGETFRNMSLGKIPFGIGSPTAAVAAYNAGVPIKAIASYGSPGSIAWVVPKDSAIKTLSDLNGKKIGFSSPSSASHAAVALTIKKAGLKGVSLVPAGSKSANWAAVKRGAIDAGWTSGTHLARLLSSGEAKVVFRATDHAREYPDDFVLVGQTFAQQHPDITRNFVQSLIDADEFIKTNLDQAAKYVAAYNNVAEREARSAITEDQPAIFNDVRFTLEGLKAVQDVLFILDMIKEPVDWSGLIDQSFLPAALRNQLPQKIEPAG